MEGAPCFLYFLLYTYVYNREQRGAVFFFFSKVFEPKKYSYIYIYTHVIKKKKKKNNLFRFGTEAFFFAFAGMGLYFDTSRGRRARPANEGATRVRARDGSRDRFSCDLRHFYRRGGVSYHVRGESALNAKFCVKFGIVQILLYLCRKI